MKEGGHEQAFTSNLKDGKKAIQAQCFTFKLIVHLASLKKVEAQFRTCCQQPQRTQGQEGRSSPGLKMPGPLYKILFTTYTTKNTLDGPMVTYLT